MLQPLHGLKHICAFVDSREDCVLNIVAPQNYANHVLRLHTLDDTYLNDGCFSADRMLGCSRPRSLARARQAFPLRSFGEMHWA